MHKDDQKQAIDWLRDWSKWLITINFAAATGCTLVAKGGAKGLTLVLLVLAVGAFTVSVICAALLIRASASVVEGLPYATKESNPTSVFDIPAFRGVSLRRLAHFQFISMVVGASLFFAWLLAKASSDGEVPRADKPESVTNVGITFRQKIWSEILDGRRKWKARDDSQEEFERFHIEVVCPLLELREEGRIGTKLQLDDSDHYSREYYYREGVSVVRVP